MKTRAQNQFHDTFVELIRKTSSELPRDVIAALKVGRSQEERGSRADYALGIIEKNIELGKAKSQPLCQDTGTVLFYIHYPMGVDPDIVKKVLKKAVVTATRKGYLRQNSVDSVTGRNSGNNIGPGAPVIHLDAWNKKEWDIRLMLKGGGCENVGAQYSLPDARLGAGRDLLGVKKCVLDAVQQAQGKGCGPGILGVCIGGDRGTGYLESKEQFLRLMTDKNKNSELSRLEAECLEEANRLGIGPMGFGGRTTLLAVKAAALNRVPASFFVSISYMCWAFRRQGLRASATGEIKKWIY